VWSDLELELETLEIERSEFSLQAGLGMAAVSVERVILCAEMKSAAGLAIPDSLGMSTSQSRISNYEAGRCEAGLALARLDAI
jgi:hypothetical protein